MAQIIKIYRVTFKNRTHSGEQEQEFRVRSSSINQAKASAFKLLHAARKRDDLAGGTWECIAVEKIAETTR